MAKQSAVAKEVIEDNQSENQTTTDKSAGSTIGEVPATEVQALLNQADQELIDAGNQAEAIAVEEGVEIKQHDTLELVAVSTEKTAEESTNSPQRRRMTTDERLARAKRQHDLGERMLKNRRAGLASVNVKVVINNYLIAANFTRFFPVVDQCLYIMRSQGEFRLGETSANSLLKSMLGHVTNIQKKSLRELEATSQLTNEASKRRDFISPAYAAPAYEGDVQVKTPEALLLLNAFLNFDKVLHNIEILHWNQERHASDVRDAQRDQKQIITPLFAMCVNTLVRMRNRVRNNSR